MKIKINLLFLLTIIIFENSFAQTSELFVPRNVQKAFLNKTRSIDGLPGSNYWQNTSDYFMDILFNPTTRLLSGKEKINYSNNSPDTLKEIIVHLYPNFFKKGVVRDFSINTADEGEGVKIEKILYNGTNIDLDQSKKRIIYSGTNLIIKLADPILPFSKAEFTFDWNYILCQGSGVRTGTIDSSTFFIAYFFPHIAVYDDIDGWNDFQYTGGVEFYNDFSNYNVSITVPKNFIVNASGVLQNAENVLAPKYFERYKTALVSDEIINIIDSNDILIKDITTQNQNNTWKFEAKNITDFCFALSDHYLWDGSGLVVDKNTGRRVFIDAAYNKDSKDYYKVAKTSREEINYMSNVLPGYPFPFPVETVFNGSGGMEYPMMVNDSSVPDSDMVGLAAHEISHSYFPFFMGTNESKHAWMDEGWAAYIDYKAASSLYNIEKIKKSRVAQYKKAIGNDIDVPIITSSKYLKSPVYRYNAYIKAAYFYDMLNNFLGKEKFTKALHVYIERWNGKHPIPYDFFNSMSDASKENLDWLIKPWFFEFGYLDLAIKEIVKLNNSYEIVIAKNGLYPGQFKLELTFEDGSTEILNENASVWKNGNNIFTIAKSNSKKILKARLFDDIWLDADNSNDEYFVK